MRPTKKSKTKNVVVIGGGTGTFTVLSALKDYHLHLTAIVSMADDGGSTGALRDQYGVLPPGDIRRALVALSASDTLRDLFNYRFLKGDLAGHNFGNIFLSALEQVKGNFALAVDEASRVLNIKGKVLPVTLDNVRLCARLADGKIINGETNIDIPRSKIRARISEIWLNPAARVNPEAKKAVLTADLIVIGPGDLYTSLIPNLLVKGLPEAIKKSRAKKVFVCNLMTKYGETNGFKAEDFAQKIEKYLGRGVLDFAIFNNKKPHPKILARYRKEGAEFIEPPKPPPTPAFVRRGAKENSLPPYEGGREGLGVKYLPKYILADLLDNGPFIRHNPRQKLARALTRLLDS